MKKTISILGCVLLAFVAFVPLSKLCFLFSDRVLELTCAPGFYLVGAVLALGLLILVVRYGPSSRLACVLFAATALLSIAGLLFAGVYYSKTPLAVVFAALTVFCCIGLAITHAASRAFRITGIVLSVGLMVPVSFLTFLMVLFGNIGCRTVVQTAMSPDGAYCAELIDDDQGACGGNTEVEVKKTSYFDGLFFRVTEPARTVYFGQWGEFKDMTIRWKDDRCLLINEKEYPIE